MTSCDVKNSKRSIGPGSVACSRVLFLLLLITQGSILRAQIPDPISTETRAEHYMRHGRLAAKVALTFPGPGGGYTMAHFPVREITKYGDTLTVMHAFLIDVGTANEGDYIPPDTQKTSTGYVPWEFPVGPDRTIHVELAPSSAHPEYRTLDSTYMGTLGYAFLKKFISVFDFKNKTLSLYPLYSTVDIAIHDTLAIQGGYLDDAFLTYCHCPYPTIWLAGEALPLKPGHVHLALASPHSQVFEPSLDDETRESLKARAKADSLTGRKPSVGLSLQNFTVLGANLARHSPHRFVAPLPPVFKDLSEPIMGTMATDVLRTFSALIIDPSRTRIILVK